MKPQQKEYFFTKNTQKNLDIKNIVFTFATEKNM